VIDFGSSPGGWTWVLQSLGCEVLSIDKAPLAPDILKLPKVTPIKKDAFTIKPQDIGPVDWFFSDIICYPEKLYEYLQLWITSGLCGNYCLTIKLQGPYSFEVIRKFQNIENSKVFHLHHNKHELTFVKTKG
jgi:23S rRNA (cytidine2498-2'-O)-methyltransferase